MLSEIQSELEKVKGKDLSTKKYVNSTIKDLRNELLNYKKELEDIKNSMTVSLFSFKFQDSNQDEELNTIVNKTNSHIEEMEYIKNLNMQYNNLYAALTKFGKVMAKNFENENMDNFNLYQYDKNLLYQVNFIILLFFPY